MDLADFYAARLDEDEAEARAARALWLGTHFTIEPGSLVIVGFHNRHDPDHVLREVAAGRALLAAWQEAETQRLPFEPEYAYGIRDGFADALLLAVKFRAAVYSDHPDYQQEWVTRPRTA
jgi:hypothetical protein